MKWFWLSYADDDRFRGVVIMQAMSAQAAVIAARAAGLSPGGQVIALEAPADVGEPPAGYIGRLLDRTEIGEMMMLWQPDDPKVMSWGEWEQENAS